MFTLGDFIKEKRKAANISLQKLGDTVGISDSEMMKIENGARKNPHWQTLCKIAESLNIHPFEILLTAGYISQDDINPQLLIRGLEKLSKEEVKTVQLFIDFIADQKNTGCNARMEK